MSCCDGAAAFLDASAVTNTIFERICEAIGTSSLAVRQEMLVHLWEIVKINGQSFSWASPLFSTDREFDFFHNVAHFQISRRIKAWQRVVKFLQGQSQDEDAMETDLACDISKLAKFLVPLLMQVIFEGKSNDKTKHKKQHQVWLSK